MRQNVWSKIILGSGLAGLCGTLLAGCGGGSSASTMPMMGSTASMARLSMSVQVTGVPRAGGSGGTTTDSLVFQAVMAGTNTPVGAAVPLTLDTTDLQALANNQPISPVDLSVPTGVLLQVVVTPEINGSPVGTPGTTSPTSVAAGQTVSVSATCSFLATANGAPHMFLLGTVGTSTTAVRLDGVPTPTATATLNVPNGASPISIEANASLNEVDVLDFPGTTEELDIFDNADQGTNLAISTALTSLPNSYDDAVTTEVTGSHLLTATGPGGNPSTGLDIDVLDDPSGTLVSQAIDPSNTNSGHTIRVDPAFPSSNTPTPVAFVLDQIGDLEAFLDPFTSFNANATPTATFNGGGTIQPMAIDYDPQNHTLWVLALDTTNGFPDETLDVYALNSTVVQSSGLNLATPTFTLTNPANSGNFDSGSNTLIQDTNPGIAVDVPLGATAPAFIYFTFSTNTNQQILFLQNPPTTTTLTPQTATLFTDVPAGFNVQSMAVDDDSTLGVARILK